MAITASLLAGVLPAVVVAQSAGHRMTPARTAVPRVLAGGLASLSGTGRGRDVVARYGGLHVRQGRAGAEVAVTIDVAGDAPGTLDALRTLATFIRSGAGYVEAYVPVRSLDAVAAIRGVTRVEPIRSPQLAGYTNPGVAAIGADAWQAAAVDGTGVKVGIIDGGFEGFGARGAEVPQLAGSRCYADIGTVSASFSACETATSHGTDVLETAADVAPGASFYVSNAAEGSWNDIADTIDWMTSNGVRVINASWGSVLFEGPGDGTSRYGNSLYALVDRAASHGALWVSASGNSGTLGWTGAWKDEDQNGWLEFASGAEDDRIDLQAGDHLQVAIRWPGKWGASDDTAYGVGIYPADPDAPALVSSFDFPNTCQGDPCGWIPDFVAPATADYYIAIKRFGAPVSSMQLLVSSPSAVNLTYRTAAGTLAAPADSSNPGMIAVGAADVSAPSTVEDYSSRGPTVDGRMRPDLVAPDCAQLSTGHEFCGTSQAAPFATGAAALALQANPAIKTPAAAAAWLRAHARAIGTPVPNGDAGYGLLALGAPPAVPAVPAALVFGAAPRVLVAATPATGPVTVRILDGNGSLVTSGTGATGGVTLALGANPGGGTLACQGGQNVNAVAGVATFQGCTVDREGTGYTLVAASGTLPPVTSAAFDVLPAGTVLPEATITATASAITWGKAVEFSTLLMAGGVAAADRPVRLEMSGDGSTWTTAGASTTDATGRAAFTRRPPANAWYRLAYDGAADMAPATSSSVRVVVRQIALVRPAPASRPIVVTHGARVTFVTTIRPSRADLPVPKAAYEVYRLVGSRWKLVTRKTVTADATGAARLAVAFASSGSWYVRSMAVPTSMNANSAWSAPVRYTVR